MVFLKSTQDVVGICRHLGRKHCHRVFLRQSHPFWASIFPFGKCMLALYTLSKSGALLPEGKLPSGAFLDWTGIWGVKIRRGRNIVFCLFSIPKCYDFIRKEETGTEDLSKKICRATDWKTRMNAINIPQRTKPVCKFGERAIGNSFLKHVNECIIWMSSSFMPRLLCCVVAVLLQFSVTLL